MARFAVAIALLLGWTTGHAAQALATETRGRTVPLPAHASASVFPPETGKLAPDLLSLVNALRGMSPAERVRGSQWRADHIAPPVFKVAGPDASYLEIYIHLDGNNRRTFRDLRDRGVVLQLFESDSGIAQGYAPLESIECLAELPGIARIARPTYSICNTAQSYNQGAYVSEAERLMEIDFFRGSQGLDGTGQAIGVLSVGLYDQFNSPPNNATEALNDRRVRSGDFPERLPNWFNPGQGYRHDDLGGIRVFPAGDYSVHRAPTFYDLLRLPGDLSRTADPVTGEVVAVPYAQQRPLIGPLALGVPRAAGALMLEVVRDLAPNARLLFGAARTDVEFYINRDRMVAAPHGARVIIDDVSFPGLGRYDGTSALSQRATELVRHHDVVCVTAVGDFTPPPFVAEVNNDEGIPAYHESGTWAFGDGAGWDGGTVRQAPTVENHRATWNANLVEGYYDIAVIYRAGSNRATKAKYIIGSDYGNQVAYLDQTVKNNIWVNLGMFYLSGGINTVTLDALGSTPYGRIVVADSVRFIPRMATAAGKPLFINTFFNPDSTNFYQNFHSFSSPGSTYRDEMLNVRPDPELGYFEAFLVWDDVWVNPQFNSDEQRWYFAKSQPPGRATDDLDLYLVDRDSLNFAHPIAFSNNLQNGRTDNPVERIFTVGHPADQFSLLIRRKNAHDNRRTFMTLVITAGIVEDIAYLTHGIPLCNADAVGGVVSVGSIDLRQPDLNKITPDTVPGLDPGPGAMPYMRFLQWRPGAQKPDICGFENVATFTGRSQIPSTQKYYARGTSIAAAHVGAFCALVRQMRPDLRADQFHALLTDTSMPPGSFDPDSPNALEIMTDIPNTYGNAPRYKRLRAGNVFRNLLRDYTPPPARAGVSEIQHFADGPGLWTYGPPPEGSPFQLPEFLVLGDALVLRAQAPNTFGYWESPVLTFEDFDTGSPTSTLKPDRLYRLRARISSDQPDPGQVPDFRIRLITTSADEVAELVINSVSDEGTNAPRDGQPRDYYVYYQPTPEAALFALRVAIDMIHFHPDDDSTAALYIHEVELEEFELPVSRSAAGR